MAPGSSPDLDGLLDVARRSLEHGVRTGRPLPVDPREHPPALRQERASFVTLRLGEALRGCIGSLEAHRPLVVDVAENAFRAGFHDPRFEPITREELERVEVHLSILSPLVRIEVASRDELLSELRPGIDGLLMSEGARRGTFLPAVWEQLPEPSRFLLELERKAGLPPDHWSPELEVWRYTVKELS